MPRFVVVRNAGEIRSLPNLLTKVRKEREKSPTGAVWLRGVDDARHSLLPSIGRPQQFAGTIGKFNQDVEWRLLHRFRRYAYEFVGRELTLWETLFVARHHGLPVRLLDWTSSPLVALYFACEFLGKNQFLNAAVPNGKIWMLIPNEKQDKDERIDVFNRIQDPLEVKGIRLIYPMVVAPRINAQSGFFTIQDDPWKPLEESASIEYAQADLDVLRIVEFTVLGENRAKWLQELNDQGVTRRTLFPDLDGLAAGLTSAQILRRNGGHSAKVK